MNRGVLCVLRHATVIVIAIDARDAGAQAATKRATERSTTPTSRFFTGIPAPGKQLVGYSRDSIASGPVHVWYPRARSQMAPMRLRDYVLEQSASLATFWQGAGVSQAAADSVLDTRIHAVQRGVAVGGPYPVVVVAQGNGGDLFDQLVLCEYLASTGLVVATRASPTVKTPMTDASQVGDMAHQQAIELSELIDAMAGMPAADTARIAVVGHSMGARAALLLAMIDRRVRAIVSLDGGIGTATAVDAFRGARSFRADAPLPPLLHFYETLDGFMKPDFTLLEQLQFRERRLEPTAHLRHTHFSTYGFMTGVAGIARATRADAQTGAAAGRVLVETTAFLWRHLRPGSRATRRSAPRQEGR